MALAGDSCDCSLYRCLGLRNNRTRASTALQGTVGYPILKKKKRGPLFEETPSQVVWGS